MASLDLWKPFRDALEQPWDYARAWKEHSGGKVIGHLLPDVPEEIIHAARALPVAVEGAGMHPSRAQAHIPGYTCNHAMGAMEMGLRGDLDVLDGMVIPYVCDTTRNLFHIWNQCFPRQANEFLRLPKRVNHPEARNYLRAEFKRFLGFMEAVTGRQIGPDDLAASCALCNRSRSRLREAYHRHLQQPHIWTGERIRLLTGSALRASRDQHLAWMDVLPWEDASSPGEGERIPLYVRGKVWDPPDVTRVLDEIGFALVQDEIVTGFRSIEQDADPVLDPIDALVNRHVMTVPYTGYHLEPQRLVQDFVQRVRNSEAQAVLFLNPKFCEAAAFDTPDFQAALERERIPSLILETSARGVSLEQVRMRLEAFREMIAGDLP